MNFEDQLILWQILRQTKSNDKETQAKEAFRKFRLVMNDKYKNSKVEWSIEMQKLQDMYLFVTNPIVVNELESYNYESTKTYEDIDKYNVKTPFNFPLSKEFIMLGK